MRLDIASVFSMQENERLQKGCGVSPIEELEALAATIRSNSALSIALGKPWVFRKAKENISLIFGRCDPNQRKLFLSLLSRYKVLDQYEPYAYIMVQRIISYIESGRNVIITTPSIQLNSRPKSGDHLLYEIKSQLNGQGFSDNSFSTRNLVPEKSVEGAVYVIVDDFSGTGDTITNAIEKLLAIGVKAHNVKVEVIYAMDTAFKNIIGRGVLVNRQLSSKKSISEFDYEGEGMSFNVGDAYDELESSLVIGETYKRGYKQSEALISMKRTPNNTLPIFWLPEAREGEWPAPFPR